MMQSAGWPSMHLQTQHGSQYDLKVKTRGTPQEETFDKSAKVYARWAADHREAAAKKKKEKEKEKEKARSDRNTD